MSIDLISKTPVLHRSGCLRILKNLYISRLADQKMQILVKQNKGTTFFLSTAGHELVGSVASLFFHKGDWFFPYYRDRAFALGIGVPLEEIMGAFLARNVPHHSSGRMMLDHFSDKEKNIACQSSVVGSQFLQAVGRAKGLQLKDENGVVYVSSGDGATSQGDFHEALNFSSIHQLPVIFVVQDNDWAISVPSKQQTSGASVAAMARGYEGLTIFDIDGCDYEQLFSAFSQAVLKGREKKGPSLIVAKVPRIAPHTNSDDPAKYQTSQYRQELIQRDPIPRFEQWLLDKDLISASEIASMKIEAKEIVEQQSELAEKMPFAPSDSVEQYLFREKHVVEVPVQKEGETVVMMDALNHALMEEMERDPEVIVFGEDVADGKGGVFGITRGLSAKFGKNRCFNTPLAESTIAGIAAGLSLEGFKPVGEIQFADYVWPAMNQIACELSSISYRSNGEWSVPVVLRMPYGGYIQGGPYHSQSIEAIFTHIPGLKVVIPSNAADAKLLLKTAIRDPNPVIFFEHKALYRQKIFSARPEPDKEAVLPFGKASIICPGEDITLIAWGMMVSFAYEVASSLKKEISVEVIDLRTLVPLDFETILHSVKKTGKVMIVHEAPLIGGFGAELAAQIADKGFTLLDAPILRIGGKHCPVPYAKNLENAVLPQKQDIEQAIRNLSKY
ncbi:MAG: MFS transporter [Parachlamydiales bacterium]|nr:MFS transporter [Parachlamydiales bacterium]